MARSIRIEYPGAFYHVMARGNRRQSIFEDDDDRRFFLHALSEACGKTGWRVQAWVLMGNHYHLFLETPEANLVAGMQWLQNTYTRRFNTRHEEWGRLFGDRYKAVVVEGKAGDYYGALCDYIHLNPVRAGLIRVAQGESVMDYPWSSLASGYALLPKQRAPWLAVADGLVASNLPDTTAGRRWYVEHLDERARAEPRKRCGVPEAPADGRVSNLRFGWYWGSQAFAERLLEIANGAAKKARSRSYRSSLENKAHDERTAELLVKAGLKRAGLAERELKELRGSDQRKVKIAQTVWRHTAVSQGWIAGRLQMRSAAHVSQLLRRVSQSEK
jgi:REP element-mobilizing transposase RayT